MKTPIANVAKDTITATLLKRFFRTYYGIPVRVQSNKHYVQVWIPYDRARTDAGGMYGPLVYNHTFPPELGNMCMRIVYKGHASLAAQNWGGNVSSNSIAMHRDQWVELIEKVMQARADDQAACYAVECEVNPDHGGFDK